MSNPFTAEVEALTNPNGSPPQPNEGPRFVRFSIVYAAEGMWDLLAALPNKPEATLAQRRLEEAVFWANRAAAAPKRN